MRPPPTKTKGPIHKKKEKTFFSAFLTTLRKRKIIQTLAAFIGGGWLIIEAVHWILIDHFHFPEVSLDITIVTLACTLISTLIWQWFRGIKRRPRKIKWEFILIPVLILVTAFFDIRLIQRIGEHEEEISSETGWRKMIVVLPFDNLGPPEDDYFASGVAEEITSRLAAVRELGVISRTSAVEYDRTGKTLRQIGEDLGVDYVLEGSVRWDRSMEGKSRVRITPQLIRVSDDTHLWSARYDRVIEDIFAVQSDIAEKIIHQLGITLLEPEKRALKAKPTDNLEAYQAYLRGIDYLMKSDESEEQYRLAVQMFERAVKLDPNFALAFMGISEALSMLAHYRYDLTEENISKAKAAADRVLELQPESPEGHMALGFYYYNCHKDYDRALEELTIAERDLPNNSRIPEYIGYIRRRQGNFEAAADNLKKAFELNPQAANLPWELGLTYDFLRRHPEAERYYDRSIFLAPDQTRAYVNKAFSYWLQGSLEKARAMLEEMPKRTDPQSISVWHLFWILQELYERNYQAALELVLSSDFVDYYVGRKALLTGLVYSLMNEPELARDSFDSARILLEKEAKERPDDPLAHSQLGNAYAGLGRKEEAIREGKLGMELYPVSKDALDGPYYVILLAVIYVMVGEYDAALDKIEYLLSIPSDLSVPLLRLDPQWDPLRDHPRFKRLLEKNSQDDS